VKFSDTREEPAMALAVLARWGYMGSMLEQRIKDLEALLVTANAALEASMAANAKLKTDLAASELSNKRIRRNARQDESKLKTQLDTAQRTKAW
jgi:septal ring factor EnvC (AmiA/AmiB activator)